MSWVWSQKKLTLGNNTLQLKKYSNLPSCFFGPGTINQSPKSLGKSFLFFLTHWGLLSQLSKDVEWFGKITEQALRLLVADLTLVLSWSLASKFEFPAIGSWFLDDDWELFIKDSSSIIADDDEECNHCWLSILAILPNKIVFEFPAFSWSMLSGLFPGKDSVEVDDGICNHSTENEKNSFNFTKKNNKNKT